MTSGVFSPKVINNLLTPLYCRLTPINNLLTPIFPEGEAERRAAFDAYSTTHGDSKTYADDGERVGREELFQVRLPYIIYPIIYNIQSGEICVYRCLYYTLRNDMFNTTMTT